MRAAIFTDHDFDKVNGVTTTLRAALQHAPAGIRPRIYTACDIGGTSDQYFGVSSVGVELPLHPAMRLYWPRVSRLARELRASGVDLIHVTTPGPIGLAARWLARRLHVPLTGSYHTHLGEYVGALSGSRRAGMWTDQYVRWLYEKCDPLLVPSIATRDMLADLGYSTERCRVWSRGVNASVFDPARRSFDLRESWRVDDRRPAVIYVGRLSREKGLDLLAPLQRALDSARVAHRLIVVGDGPMAPALREACPDAVFLGSVPHDRVAVAMASADVFLFPSATDSFGNVVIEAQAAGLPTLVTDRGGPQEQIRTGETGHVCRPGHVQDFAARLTELLRDRPRRLEMGGAARAHALRRDWPAVLSPLYGAWQDAVRAHALSPQSQPQAGSLHSPAGATKLT